MSMLRRWLGLGEDDAVRSSADTATVRRIAGQLEALPEDEARYLASFAYVLARIAHADLQIDDEETAEMERRLTGLSDLSAEQCALVVEIAKSQAQLLGGTENYVVTRQFRQLSNREQRGRLLSCVYAVAAADGTISAEEAAEITVIGEELGFTRAETNAFRAEYRDQISVLRK
jgi:uncharacterized tellurite resistance protein B-like protein